MRLLRIGRLSLFGLVTILMLEANGWAQSPNCPGADPNDNNDDGVAIYSCLQNNLAVYLEPGNPGYIVQNQKIIINRSNAVLSSVGGKATIRAHPDFNRAIIEVENDPSGYEISELILDGNHANRTRKDLCPNGFFGSNLIAKGSGYTIHHVDTINAMCGSGLEASGSNYEIYSVYSANNGDEAPSGSWADGMTLVSCVNSYVHNNYILNSTDVGLVVFSGQGCTIRFNEIEQLDAYAFAAVKIGDTFGQTADLAGSVTKDNVIFANENKASFGLLVGHHPWSTSGNIADAGEVSYNEVEGAMANLVVDGIDGGVVVSNSMWNARGTRAFSCSYTADYTAAHFGNATLQGGYTSFSFDQGC